MRILLSSSGFLLILFFLSLISCSTETLEDRLFKSCMSYSLKVGDQKEESKNMCKCMASKLMTAEYVTDNERTKLAENWGNVPELKEGEVLKGQEGDMVGVSISVWGECMSELYPDKVKTPVQSYQSEKNPEESFDTNGLDMNTKSFISGLKSRSPFKIKKALIDANIRMHGNDFISALNSGIKYMEIKPSELRGPNHDQTLEYLRRERERLQ